MPPNAQRGPTLPALASNGGRIEDQPTTGAGDCTCHRLRCSEIRRLQERVGLINEPASMREPQSQCPQWASEVRCLTHHDPGSVTSLPRIHHRRLYAARLLVPSAMTRDPTYRMARLSEPVAASRGTPRGRRQRRREARRQANCRGCQPRRLPNETGSRRSRPSLAFPPAL